MTFETFENLNLAPELLRAVAEENYTQPTPIQAQAIPVVLEGRDVLGCAQTGTGKTAAFALPILDRLTGTQTEPGKPVIRALILSPTRELAGQIGDSFTVYGKYTGLKHTVVFGGVSQGNQVRALTQGVDILVATPGRLLDLMQQGHINLRHVEVLVLDEADRMLDMGFIGDIRRIISKLSKQHQTLFFSATMPPEIQKLADDILKNPVYVSVAPVSSTTEQVDQHVYMVDKPNKRALLLYLLSTTQTDRVLVFTRTRSRADMLERFLNAAKIGAEAIHSDKTQSARQRALENFKSGESRVLVATDIASRGIDVEGISHVINFDIPEEPETYVHRIGRTGRAGAVGIALTFCDPSELFYLADIEQVINRQIPILPEHPSLAEYQGPSSSQYGGRGKPGGSRPGRSQSGRSSGSGRPRQEGGGSSQQGGVEAMPNPRRRRRRPKATAAQG